MNAVILLTALFAQGPGYPATITVTYQGQSIQMVKILDATDGIGHHAEQSWDDDAGVTHHEPIVRYRADYRGSYLFWERTDLEGRGIIDRFVLAQ